MLKKTLKISIVLFLIANGLYAQQWSGSTTTSGVISRDGNVGINTSTPVHNFQVNGWSEFGDQGASDSYNYGILQLTRNANSGDEKFHLAFIRNGNIVTGVGYVPNTNTFGMWASPSQGSYSTPTLSFTPNANVGIGTSTPEAKLHVNIFQGSSSIPQSGLLIKTASFYTGDNAANSYYLKAVDAGAAESTAFILKGNGSVGIGTENTGGFKLAVEGGIAARSVKVTSTAFADYVFEPTYKLRPLSTVESYINENKHLPGMPSAKEVEKDGGFELAAMNVKLLEKIEELTLYVIEIKKENEQMKKAINDLKRKKN